MWENGTVMDRAGRTLTSFFAGALLVLLLCVVPAFGCSSAAEDGASGATGGYGNVLQFGGVYYEESDFGGDAGPRLEGAEPGPVFAEVEGRLRDRNSAREIRDGDAGVLPKGTPVHAVRGYDPSFRLAARAPNGRWALYEANENPKARRGEDLLDIGGKVERIEIGPSVLAPAGAGGAEKEAVIKDPREVRELVGAALGAPVWRGDTLAGDRQVVFRLYDGTATGGNYAAGSGKLSTDPGGSDTGVVLPQEFRRAIDRATRG